MAHSVFLGVNIDHIATLRQARQAPEPDPVQAAAFAELGGADGSQVFVEPSALPEQAEVGDASLAVYELTKQSVPGRMVEALCSRGQAFTHGLHYGAVDGLGAGRRTRERDDEGYRAGQSTHQP